MWPDWVQGNGSIGVLATLRDSNTVLCTNSQTLYTEGLVRLRRRQIISGLSEIIFRTAALLADFALRATILHETQNYLEGGEAVWVDVRKTEGL